MAKAKYRRRFVGNGKWREEHALIAERVLGKPLPAGAEVHHVDGDKLNNDTTNLVICPSRSYHQLLHKRQRALEQCGHPEWLKCRFCKTYDAPENVVSSGNNVHHRKCDAEYARRLRNR